MKNKTYTNGQLFGLVVLRILIGWHFLYEGIIKVLNPAWSSISYLNDSKGFLSDFFYSIASNPDVLKAVDFLNEWGLSLIGLGLVLGLFSKIATYSGIVLLAMYYLSHPPVFGLDYALPSEGSYLIVNKTLIELSALVVLLLFPTSKNIGMDRLVLRKSNR